MVGNDPAGKRYGRSHATVVIDRVAMRYKVQSTESPRNSRNKSLISRFVGRGNEVTVSALNEISLVVEHGESIGIIGRNGSGKSTLTRLISGQTKPTSGAVYASATPVMLGVNAALIPELSGDQNIVLGCLAMGIDRRTIAQKFSSITELSGLGDAVYLPMKSYSSGMASRLRFAIATSIDPEILLIDEALNTGDAQFRERSRTRMNQLRAQAGTVFLVSHSLDTIRDMCSRAIWLDKGDLLMDGDAVSVTKAYSRFTWHLTHDNEDFAAKLRRDARESLVATQILERTSGRRSA